MSKVMVVPKVVGNLKKKCRKMLKKFESFEKKLILQCQKWKDFKKSNKRSKKIPKRRKFTIFETIKCPKGNGYVKSCWKSQKISKNVKKKLEPVKKVNSLMSEVLIL